MGAEFFVLISFSLLVVLGRRYASFHAIDEHIGDIREDIQELRAKRDNLKKKVHSLQNRLSHIDHEVNKYFKDAAKRKDENAQRIAVQYTQKFEQIREEYEKKKALSMEHYKQRALRDSRERCIHILTQYLKTTMTKEGHESFIHQRLQNIKY